MFTPILAEVCVKSIIFNSQGKVLLLKRREDGMHGDTWDLPGGLLQEGEKPEDGLLREVKEETGLQIRDMRPVFTHGAIPGSTNRYCVWIWFSAKLVDGNITLDEENSEFLWMQPAKAMQMSDELFPVVHKQAIKTSFSQEP